MGGGGGSGYCYDDVICSSSGLVGDLHLGNEKGDFGEAATCELILCKYLVP